MRRVKSSDVCPPTLSGVQPERSEYHFLAEVIDLERLINILQYYRPQGRFGALRASEDSMLIKRGFVWRKIEIDGVSFQYAPVLEVCLAHPTELFRLPLTAANRKFKA